MIAEGLKFLFDKRKDPTVKIGERFYQCDLNNQLTPIEVINRVNVPEPELLFTNTLTSFVDYLDDDPDNIDINDIFIHIEDHKTVTLKTHLKGDNLQRLEYIKAFADTPGIKFEQYLTLEDMLVMLNSSFQTTNDLNKIVSIISKVTEISAKETSDDGWCQNVQVKSGVEFKNDEELPRIVTLKPYTTFPEADQPESDFLLRVRKRNNELTYGLFRADGGKWKNDARINIKDKLQELMDNCNLNIPIFA